MLRHFVFERPEEDSMFDSKLIDKIVQIAKDEKVITYKLNITDRKDLNNQDLGIVDPIQCFSNSTSLIRVRDIFRKNERSTVSFGGNPLDEDQCFFEAIEFEGKRIHLFSLGYTFLVLPEIETKESLIFKWERGFLPFGCNPLILIEGFEKLFGSKTITTRFDDFRVGDSKRIYYLDCVLSTHGFDKEVLKILGFFKNICNGKQERFDFVVSQSEISKTPFVEPLTCVETWDDPMRNMFYPFCSIYYSNNLAIHMSESFLPIIGPGVHDGGCALMAEGIIIPYGITKVLLKQKNAYPLASWIEVNPFITRAKRMVSILKVCPLTFGVKRSPLTDFFQDIFPVRLGSACYASLILNAVRNCMPEYMHLFKEGIIFYHCLNCMTRACTYCMVKDLKELGHNLLEERETAQYTVDEVKYDTDCNSIAFVPPNLSSDECEWVSGSGLKEESASEGEDDDIYDDYYYDIVFNNNQ